MEGQVCRKTFRVTHENNYYTNRISSPRLGDIRAKLISSNSINGRRYDHITDPLRRCRVIGEPGTTAQEGLVRGYSAGMV